MNEKAKDLPGRLVYRFCEPLDPGIILEVGKTLYTSPDGAADYAVKVHWRKGNTVSWHRSWQLNDFEFLMKEHARKAERFAKLAEDLRAAAGKGQK